MILFQIKYVLKSFLLTYQLYNYVLQTVMITFIGTMTKYYILKVIKSTSYLNTLYSKSLSKLIKQIALTFTMMWKIWNFNMLSKAYKFYKVPQWIPMNIEWLKMTIIRIFIPTQYMKPRWEQFFKKFAKVKFLVSRIEYSYHNLKYMSLDYYNDLTCIVDL